MPKTSIGGGSNQSGPVKQGVMGWDLYATLFQQAEYQNYYDTQRPVACPSCGEPLREGPPQEEAILYCPWGHFQYPRDYEVRAHSGM